MSVTDVQVGIRLSDPKPAVCSGCGNSPDADTRCVDFDAACDRGWGVDADGNDYPVEDLHLCEVCVRSAAERLGFKPELHERQRRQIQQARLRAEHFKALSERLQDALDKARENYPGDDGPTRGRR